MNCLTESDEIVIKMTKIVIRARSVSFSGIDDLHDGDNVNDKVNLLIILL